jgi:hypothetical protein
MKLECDEWEKLRILLSNKRRPQQKYLRMIKSFQLVSDHETWITGASKIGNFQVFLKGCSNLTNLQLDTPCLNDDNIWILTAGCKFLQKLKITSNSSYGYGKLTDAGIETLAMHAKSLTELYISCVSNFDLSLSDRGIHSIAQGFGGRLQGFGLEVKEITAANKLVDFERNFGNHDDFNPSHSIKTDHALIKNGFTLQVCKLIQSHSSLRIFKLDWPCDMETVLECLGNSSRKLDCLKIGNCRDSAELKNLISKNPQLKSLSLYEINASEPPTNLLLPLSNRDTKLEKLELLGACKLTSILPSLPSFTRLRCLVFSPTTRLASVRNSSPSNLVEIASSCPLLEKIVLPIFDDETLISFATNCPRISFLSIQDGRNITNRGIEAMSSVLRLSHLCLGDTSLSEPGVRALVAGQKQTLTVLELPSAFETTHQNFLLICEQLHNLKKLYNISSEFSCETIWQGLGKAKKLTEVSFGRSNGPIPLGKLLAPKLKVVAPNIKYVMIE